MEASRRCRGCPRGAATCSRRNVRGQRRPSPSGPSCWRRARAAWRCRRRGRAPLPPPRRRSGRASRRASAPGRCAGTCGMTAKLSSRSRRTAGPSPRSALRRHGDRDSGAGCAAASRGRPAEGGARGDLDRKPGSSVPRSAEASLACFRRLRKSRTAIAPCSRGQLAKTTVLSPFSSTRSSRCSATARASTRRSMSRPLRTRSSGVSAWVTCSTSWLMIGPSSRSPVT